MKTLKNKVVFLKNIPKRYFVYSLIIALVLLPLICLKFYQSYVPYPTELSLSGTGTEMGTEYGERTGTRIRLLLKLYVFYGICGGNEALLESRQATALKIYDGLRKEYQDELLSLGESSGAELKALAYGNSFLDIGNSKFGCRSVVIKNGDLFLHGHNLDWDSIAGLARWTVCVIRRSPSDGRLKTVCLAYPGLIGGLDVINEKGVALSFNQLGMGKGICSEPIFIMLRRIAEYSSSFEDAQKEIINVPPGMPFIITLSDAKTGDASVFERTKDVVVERKIQNGKLGAANAPQGVIAGKTSLDQVLSQKTVNGIVELEDILRDRQVLMESNIYSAIFDFRNNRFFLASGTIPAAKGKYREFKLF